jgi:hypothetical protein
MRGIRTHNFSGDISFIYLTTKYIKQIRQLEGYDLFDSHWMQIQFTLNVRVNAAKLSEQLSLNLLMPT